MGIDLHNLALLAHAADLGASFSRTLGVGRQALFVDPPELERFRSLRGLPALAEPARPAGVPRYFEPLMQQWFGAGVVDAVDASPYEAASIVHDMNLPLSAADTAQPEGYDAVLDFGCLEHVFNFPVAWRNCVDLCRTGGHLLHAVPANNLLGHGFYQFSPELFFNLYRPENGFALAGVWLAMKAEPRYWWRVADSRQVRRRVNLCNAHETYLLVIARKVEARAELPAPQQSDYAEQEWQRSTPAQSAVSASPALGVPERSAPARALQALGLIDPAPRTRERLRALAGAGFAPPGGDFERVVVADLLRKAAPP